MELKLVVIQTSLRWEIPNIDKLVKDIHHVKLNLHFQKNLSYTIKCNGYNFFCDQYVGFGEGLEGSMRVWWGGASFDTKGGILSRTSDIERAMQRFHCGESRGRSDCTRPWTIQLWRLDIIPIHQQLLPPRRWFVRWQRSCCLASQFVPQTDEMQTSSHCKSPFSSLNHGKRYRVVN